MTCAWEPLLALLPAWMRKPADTLGKDSLQEVRLRLGQPPELRLRGESRWLERKVEAEDLSFCVNAASRYSPWNAATVAEGYLTAAGGHRVGLCGEVTVKDGRVTGMRGVQSLCVRVARDFPGIAAEADPLRGNVLILGSPGTGKTTLLRDLIRRHSDAERGAVAVVDERGELFPRVGGAFCFPTGRRTDVLTGCAKPEGISLALRCMGPACIAVDEITAARDCDALAQAGWCGVSLLATAHARDKREFLARPIYRPLAQSGLFQTLLVLAADKSWHAERMEGCI